MRITAYRFIMAAMAALAAGALAVSCSKEPVAGEHGGGGSDGVRTISVSFGGGTKTALGDKKADGTIPAEFKAGDVILVSNGSALEDCKVIIGSDGKASITTTLKGDLRAVYPPEAAVYLGYNITGFKVSDSQSGRFEDAHICRATIPEGTTEAHFNNETAILKFYVDASIGVTSIKVTSSGADIATGSKTITVTAPRGKTLADVTDDTKKRICYVSVLPGVKASELTYETVTTTQPTLPRTPTDDVPLTASELYKAFMPYYITIGSQRWGYCNIGAFLPEEAGRYFAWGDTEGQTWTGSAWSGGGFSTAPDVGSPVPAELPLQYDAAYQNWGGSWRIPTSAEYSILISGSGTTTSDFVDTADKKGLQIHGTDLFFPAAGYGNDTSLTDAGSCGNYWSSSLYTDTSKAYCLGFLFGSSPIVKAQADGFRFNGFPIRPILNDAWWYEDLDDGGTI